MDPFLKVLDGRCHEKRTTQSKSRPLWVFLEVPFIFKPGENHQIINSGKEDMVVYVVADNPVGETFYYPDSQKLGVPLPSRSWIMAKPSQYFEGEE